LKPRISIITPSSNTSTAENFSNIARWFGFSIASTDGANNMAGTVPKPKAAIISTASTTFAVAAAMARAA